MNLPSLIETFERTLPGWARPIALLHNPTLDFWYLANSDAIPESQVAAIIVASVKEWLVEQRWSLRILAGFGDWNVRINMNDPGIAGSEIEALAAACEAMKGKSP